MCQEPTQSCQTHCSCWAWAGKHRAHHSIEIETISLYLISQLFHIQHSSSNQITSNNIAESIFISQSRILLPLLPFCWYIKVRWLETIYPIIKKTASKTTQKRSWNSYGNCYFLFYSFYQRQFSYLRMVSSESEPVLTDCHIVYTYVASDVLEWPARVVSS